MATKKTVLNEKTTEGYDILHPETDINYVLDVPSGKTAKELIDESQVYSKHETFISTEDQTVFILQNGTYVTNQNRLEVIVGGVHQYSPDNFVETDSDRITFNNPLPLGLEVIINYFSGSSAITIDVENEINEINNEISIISNQINNHVDENSVDAHKATNITIDPIEGTTASNVQEAVSAAFQAGNSRKEELVDKLLQLDNSLQVSETDSWSTVINAISSISTGKKWIAGTVKSSSTPSDNNAEYAGLSVGVIISTITVSGLSFKPSYIIAVSKLGTAGDYLTLYRENGNAYPKVAQVTGTTDSSTGTTNNSLRLFKADKLAITVSESGFTLPVAAVGTDFDWIAFE